ncbi:MULTISPECIES: ABC transporter substrate-binding protein [Xanthobacter]|uniref:ABC transporter substrate-binding protein n=1 Tax=Xanthobacter TaxID=279 RepID=UPI0035B0993D
MRAVLLAALAAGFMAVSGLPAASADGSAGPVRVGVLTDISGYLSSALGPPTVDAARMAAEDFGGTVLGRPIEVLGADHQNKADIGAAIARRWFDEDQVQVITGMGNSAVALSVQGLAAEKNRIALFASAASTAITGKSCTRNGLHWTHDTYMFANALPKTLLAQGVDSWFLIASDYAFGRSLAEETRKVIEARGGKVVGVVYHPQGTTDFSSFLLQAQGSGAKAVAILNSGNDTVNAIKQASEFQITPRQRLVVGMLLVSDAYAIGTQLGQGLEFSTIFYWNQNPEAAAFSRRFFARNKVMPTEAHAGVYSAVTHYLKAVKAAGTTDVTTVVDKMRATPVNDFYSDNLEIRADGRLMRPAYLARIKAPSQQKEPWDLYEIVARIDPQDAFRPLAEGECPLVMKK